MGQVFRTLSTFGVTQGASKFMTPRSNLAGAAKEAEQIHEAEFRVRGPDFAVLGAII